MFTSEQLDGRSDLLPVFKGDTALLYVREDHPEFCGDHDLMMRGLRKSKDTADVYQLCRASAKRGQNLFFPLDQFRESESGWETSLHEVAKAVQRETYQAFREKNLPFLRMYMMGNTESFIVCPMERRQIDSWQFVTGIPINVWEQHHFKVRNRASIQKELADPGEILRRLDFSVVNGETLEAIKDMMRTIFLSPTAHKAVHNTWNDSDIRNYTVEQRPWALQSLSNWNTWMDYLETYGYSRNMFGFYEIWMISLELTEAEMAC